MYGISPIPVTFSEVQVSPQQPFLKQTLSYLRLRDQLSQMYKQYIKLHPGLFSYLNVLDKKRAEKLLLTVRHY
jgi:hypothetical protein